MAELQDVTLEDTGSSPVVHPKSGEVAERSKALVC